MFIKALLINMHVKILRAQQTDSFLLFSYYLVIQRKDMRFLIFNLKINFHSVVILFYMFEM